MYVNTLISGEMYISIIPRYRGCRLLHGMSLFMYHKILYLILYSNIMMIIRPSTRNWFLSINRYVVIFNTRFTWKELGQLFTNKEKSSSNWFQLCTYLNVTHRVYIKIRIYYCLSYHLFFRLEYITIHYYFIVFKEHWLIFLLRLRTRVFNYPLFSCQLR